MYSTQFFVKLNISYYILIMAKTTLDQTLHEDWKTDTSRRLGMFLGGTAVAAPAALLGAPFLPLAAAGMYGGYKFAKSYGEAGQTVRADIRAKAMQYAETRPRWAGETDAHYKARKEAIVKKREVVGEVPAAAFGLMNAASLGIAPLEWKLLKASANFWSFGAFNNRNGRNNSIGQMLKKGFGVAMSLPTLPVANALAVMNGLSNLAEVFIGDDTFAGKFINNFRDRDAMEAVKGTDPEVAVGVVNGALTRVDKFLRNLTEGPEPKKAAA